MKFPFTNKWKKPAPIKVQEAPKPKPELSRSGLIPLSEFPDGTIINLLDLHERITASGQYEKTAENWVLTSDNKYILTYGQVDHLQDAGKVNIQSIPWATFMRLAQWYCGFHGGDVNTVLKEMR